MSKDSYAPGELIGLIRFVFDKTKSRTLNATQAYDSNPSQIVLASYPATSTIKTPAKSLGKVSRDFVLDGVAAASGYTYSRADGMLATGNKRQQAARAEALKTVNFGFSLTDPGSQLGSKQALARNKSTVNFSGALGALPLTVAIDATKSNATKDIFYGAITVGTGEYKEWQGKYAVLKVDLLTNNAILRVYNS